MCKNHPPRFWLMLSSRSGPDANRIRHVYWVTISHCGAQHHSDALRTLALWLNVIHSVTRKLTPVEPWQIVHHNVTLFIEGVITARVVVIVVRELFSLVTSAICVRIRGQRSEVTKIVYHMTQVFRLLHSEFVGTI